MGKIFSIIVKCFATILLLSSCVQPGISSKLFPEYMGVDPKAEKLVQEYLWLSRQNHTEFTHSVSVGFKDIKRGNVIGICNYGANFREIDLDINYWNNSTNTSHLALVFHELTHCYCNRGHDYGDGKDYPEDRDDRIKEAMNWLAHGGKKPGRYEDDSCPVSVMYPEVLDDGCTRTHYNEYIQEMFDRCEPY